MDVLKSGSIASGIDSILHTKVSIQTDNLTKSCCKGNTKKAINKDVKEQTIMTGKCDNVRAPNEFEKTSAIVDLKARFSWLIVFIFAYFREFLRNYGFEKNKSATELHSQKNFAPLFSGLEAVYMRNCYFRIRDVCERIICSTPGSTVNLLDRKSDDYCWTFQLTGTKTEVINVGSYNYLGFAQNSGPCADAAVAALDQYGITTGSNVQNRGLSKIQYELEKQVAEYLGTEDSLCFSMGFATNSMNLPCLADEHTLIVSDKLNHASLALGCRLSHASIKIFAHNNMASLEQILQNAIVLGNPKTNKPYKKILIIVEGIYSMEGSICNLIGIIALKKKYKCYLYLDEAHSIGAIGSHGKGIVEYFGCDVNDVDIMMGTFTKSFGAAGGYIGGSKKMIDHIRANSPASYYTSPMSPPIVQQIYTSMSIIMGKDGTNDGKDRISRLARNVKYFRRHLKQKGYLIYGSDDSPVVPILFYFLTDASLFSREMLEKNIGVVVASFPATPMTRSRARICLSAAHTKEQLDIVLKAIDEVCHNTGMKHSRQSHLYKDLKIEW